MKKMFIIICSSIYSWGVVAMSVSCHTPHGNKIEYVQVVKTDSFLIVGIDNDPVEGFECITSDDSDTFTGVIRCDNIDGSLIDISNTSGKYSDGIIIIKNLPKIQLRCFES